MKSTMYLFETKAIKTAIKYHVLRLEQGKAEKTEANFLIELFEENAKRNKMPYRIIQFLKRKINGLRRIKWSRLKNRTTKIIVTVVLLLFIIAAVS